MEIGITTRELKTGYMHIYNFSFTKKHFDT